MCGIFLCVCDESNASVCKEILKNGQIHYFLSRRGPDHFEKLTRTHQFGSNGTAQSAHFTFLSSVLQLRGCFVCNQPVVHEDSGSLLQWNGQIFAGLSQSLNADQSDTEQLMEALNKAEDIDSFLRVISSIQGPWAFTFWDNRAKRLWIGRDNLGRRSLCWNTNFREQMLVVSSVAHIYSPPEDPTKTKPLSCKLNPADFVFEEIPTYGVYCFEFGAHDNLADAIANVRHFSWNRSVSGQPLVNLSDALVLNSPILTPINQTVPDEDAALALAKSTTAPSKVPFPPR